MEPTLRNTQHPIYKDARDLVKKFGLSRNDLESKVGHILLNNPWMLVAEKKNELILYRQVIDDFVEYMSASDNEVFIDEAISQVKSWLGKYKFHQSISGDVLGEAYRVAIEQTGKRWKYRRRARKALGKTSNPYKVLIGKIGSSEGT